MCNINKLTCFNCQSEDSTTFFAYLKDGNTIEFEKDGSIISIGFDFPENESISKYYKEIDFDAPTPPFVKCEECSDEVMYICEFEDGTKIKDDIDETIKKAFG
jgi:hypothetical protein